MRFTNGSNYIEVQFIPFKPGDDQAIIDCLKDEYGYTYYRKEYYNEGYFSEKTALGEADITEIITDKGEIIGFLYMKIATMFDNQIELGTMVIKKAYRHYRMSGSLIKSCVERVERMDVCACYGHSQVFHDLSVKKLYDCGLVPCGFVLSVTLSEQLVHSFNNFSTAKLSWAITLKHIAKRKAGNIFIPRRHRDIAEGIYNSLDVQYALSTNRLIPQSECSVLKASLFGSQNTLNITVEVVGADLTDIIKSEIADCDPRLLTVNLWLNLCDRFAVWAFEELEQSGFFFSGFQPLSQNAEYAVMHNPLDVEICFAEFVPFEPADYILKYVENEYHLLKQR